MLMALSTHSEFPGPIIGSDKVRSSGPGTITEYLDGFGNRMSRTVASAGLTTYWSDCVATVDGLPDKMPVGAIQHRSWQTRPTVGKADLPLLVWRAAFGMGLSGRVRAG